MALGAVRGALGRGAVRSTLWDSTGSHLRTTKGPFPFWEAPVGGRATRTKRTPLGLNAED